MKQEESNELVIFKSDKLTNEFQLILDGNNETIWASEQQIADIFGRDRSVIGKHIRNTLKEGELDKSSVWANFAQTAEDGKIYQVGHYNLDMIISVGYRVKSKVATEFRRWATQKLKEYLLQGYALNHELLNKQQHRIVQLQQSIEKLQEEVIESKSQLTEGWLTIITQYAKSFELLNQYDNEALTVDNLNDEIIYVINYQEVKQAIAELKQNLMDKGEATTLFGNEKDKSFEGILGSISQTVFGQLAYPSIEEQAAQLLYSIIKGHAFSDGNKRIGSFVFVWFLEQNNYQLNQKGIRKINENTLVALALAVAQSLPEQRAIMIRLIINMIRN